jgi:hypothetical protein
LYVGLARGRRDFTAAGFLFLGAGREEGRGLTTESTEFTEEDRGVEETKRGDGAILRTWGAAYCIPTRDGFSAFVSDLGGLEFKPRDREDDRGYKVTADERLNGLRFRDVWILSK